MSKENTATHAAINAAVVEALRMAADVLRERMFDFTLKAGHTKESVIAEILAIIPPTESDQRKLGFAEGVKAEAEKDAARLELLLYRLPGDALRYVAGELSDTSDISEFRAAIDRIAAALAQNGKE